MFVLFFSIHFRSFILFVRFYTPTKSLQRYNIFFIYASAREFFLKKVHFLPTLWVIFIFPFSNFKIL